MAAHLSPPNLRTDPVIEVARRSAVRLALIGGSAMAVAAAAQIATGDSGGLLTMAGSVPTVVLALFMTRQERPNVVLLLALISAFAIAAEAYAAWNGQSHYVVGIGSEAVVIGLGVLAVAVARERPKSIGAGFLVATWIPVVVNQVHLNGVSLEIVTDLVVVTAVMGTLMYLLIRVMDSLSESQRRYSDLANVIPVAVYELDITEAVATMRWVDLEQLTGAEKLELSERLLVASQLSYRNHIVDEFEVDYGRWGRFVTGANAPVLGKEALSILSEVARGIRSGGGEVAVRRRNGSAQDFIYRWTTGRRSGATGSISLVIAATDVTQLREAEAALARQLEERDQFVASVSHELRTPLTSIMGLTEELVNRPGTFDADEQAELLDIVASETRDVVDIVEDLLVAARGESGRLHISPEPCDLADEMYRVADLIGGNTLGTTPVWTMADPGRLRQVLRNLVSNAHRHGGPDVRMAVATDDEVATFEIRDDGAPLSPSEQERIFMPYERSSDQGVVGSVGLGLHVARLLARQMDGDLTYSHDGSDTIFRLELPLLHPVTAEGTM